MKKMILAATLCLSGSAFAYTCHVDMVDTRTNRLITTIRANDYGDQCREGMKACRLEIRQRGLLNRADCVRRTVSGPRPYPETNPRPYPGYPGSIDSRRMLSNGEVVIFNNQRVTVAGQSFNGLYAVRTMDAWNTITNNVRRESLSVTNGCNIDICTNSSVINIRTRQYVRVAGLSFDDSFVTESNDAWRTLTSRVDRNSLALTDGCTSRYYASMCVGNEVIDRYNRYSTVAGIQADGRVVLKSSDAWKTLTPNVDPAELVIIR